MDDQNNPAADTPYQRRVRVLKVKADAVYAAESAKVSERMRIVDRAREELELTEAKLILVKIEASQRIHEAQDELCEAKRAMSDAPSAAEVASMLARAARDACSSGFCRRPPRDYR